MQTTRRWVSLCTAGLGLALGGLTGCQTWVPTAGLTLPSGHYLQHRPTYTPESPPFPLPRELAAMEAQAAAAPIAPLPAIPAIGP
jgi:hypothetical protein